MYIQKVELENVGPYKSGVFVFPFAPNGRPMPVLLIGENGSGKSIFLSLIINTILAAQQIVVENTEVEKGKVFKFRSPDYIKSGEKYYYTSVEFGEGFRCEEWILNQKKAAFEKNYGFSSVKKSWGKIPDRESSVFITNFQESEEKISKAFSENVVLFFPPNRYEEPAWLNIDNLNAKCSFQEMRWIQGQTNRSVINYSPLRKNQEWLLDLIMDREIGEKVLKPIALNTNPPQAANAFLGYSGPADSLLQEILTLVKLVFKADTVTLSVNGRNHRRISISINKDRVIPNIFQFSSGELVLLNFFLTIIRDYDLCGIPFQSLSEITGIVVIDEIDSHIHTSFLYEVLPKLISKFPKVQFIFSTHSPFLVLGLEKYYSPDGICITEVPSLKRISSRRFSEFTMALSYIKETEAFEEEIEKALDAKKVLVFVEGDYDVRYINAAASLHGKDDILSQIQLIDAEGYGNLDKVQKHFDSKLAFATPGKIVLLYDCDIKKSDKVEGNVYRRVVPCLTSHPIKIGIENLFSNETIDRAMAQNPQFFNVTPEIKKMVRGKEIIVEKIIEVNRDEKRNLCDWVIRQNVRQDFDHFESVFAAFTEIITK